MVVAVAAVGTAGGDWVRRPTEGGRLAYCGEKQRRERKAGCVRERWEAWGETR